MYLYLSTSLDQNSFTSVLRVRWQPFSLSSFHHPASSHLERPPLWPSSSVWLWISQFSQYTLPPLRTINLLWLLKWHCQQLLLKFSPSGSQIAPRKPHKMQIPGSPGSFWLSTFEEKPKRFLLTSTQVILMHVVYKPEFEKCGSATILPVALWT